MAAKAFNCVICCIVSAVFDGYFKIEREKESEKAENRRKKVFNLLLLYFQAFSKCILCYLLLWKNAVVFVPSHLTSFHSHLIHSPIYEIKKNFAFHCYYCIGI